MVKHHQEGGSKSDSMEPFMINKDSQERFRKGDECLLESYLAKLSMKKKQQIDGCTVTFFG